MDKDEQMNNKMAEQFSQYKGNADKLLSDSNKESDDPERWKEILCNDCYTKLYNRMNMILECKNPFKKKIMQMKLAKDISSLDLYCDGCVETILKKTKEANKNV